MKKTRAWLIALIIAAIALNACTIAPYSTTTYEPTTFDPTQTIKAKSFSSNAEFINFAKKHQASFGFPEISVRSFSEDAMVKTMAVPQAAESVESRDFSETNVQVAGIDEADIIKTDGNYIYTTSGNTLFIIKAYPGADAKIVESIKFKNRPAGLFIKDNRLAVFGSFDNPGVFRTFGIQPYQGMTFFNIYNIQDKSNPALEKEFRFEGNYFQSRMIDNQIYFVTTSNLRTSPIRPTPIILEDTTTKVMPVEDITYFPIPYQNPQLANIHAIDIENPHSINSKSVAVEGSQNMYMSENNIFITYTEHVNEWELQQRITREIAEPKLSSEELALIQKIKKADPDVLSGQEKEQKIQQVIERYIQSQDRDAQDHLRDQIELALQQKLEQFEYFEYTIIHKIGVKNGNINVKETGKVPGHIVNQFALDEQDGILRIATTVNERWSRFDGDRSESTNNIFTLDRNLKILDSLKGLAKGERIFSTRFIENRLYMVTFRQVDPFFVIDLSNPSNIKELGQLKIPGFSRYLHPYDKDTIIGIGRDATETGRQKGIKISLFNVKDVENPTEIAKFVAKERHSQTSAEWEHKAFLFSKEKNLLVMPAYNYNTNDQEQGYNGAMVFNIEADNIELRGIIDHSFAKQQWYAPHVERSLFIEELLYTKSPSLLRINKLEDLSKVKNINLENDDGPISIY